MATSPDLDAIVVRLSDDEIMAQVGPATWGKGLIAFRSGRVLDVEHDGPRAAVASVKDSGVTYKSWIRAVDGKLDLTCACLVGIDCEHCVAGILELRERLQREQREPDTWRTILSGVAGEHHASGDPMALMIDAADPSRPVRLTPMRTGQTQEWVSKRASWSDLMATAWASVTEGLDPAQLSLLREGHRMSRREATWAPPNDVTLEQIGPQAFAWLRRLQRAGVTLLGPLEPELVDLNPLPWRLQLDAHRDEDGLSLTIVAAAGDKVVKRPRLIPECGMLALRGGLEFAELRESDELLELSKTTRTLKIPPEDIAEFQVTWLDRIRRTTDLTSEDGTYVPEELPTPDLIGALAMEGDEAVTLNWWVEFTDSETGAAHSRLPLEQFTGNDEVTTVVQQVERAAARLDLPSQLWRRHLQTLHMPAWRAPAFIEQVVERLGPDTDNAVDGLRWEVDDEVRAITVDADALEIRASARESDQTDWFDLDVTIVVAGEEVPLADILRALAAGEDHIRVGTTWVPLDDARLGRLKALLDEVRLLSDSDETRLTAMHVGVWQEIEDIADTTDAGPEWRTKIAALRDDSLQSLPVSSKLTATLRPYQEDGHRWITTLAAVGLGGILADDMGLGKTLQVLSAIQSLKDEDRIGSAPGTERADDPRPVLVVAPTSVISTWVHEARKFAPDLLVVSVTSTERRREESLAEIHSRADIVVTSYTVARLEADDFADHRWGGLVLDEAQAVKNPRTAIHKALSRIPADWCIAATGTPVENSVADLWSVLALTDPGLLPPWKSFQENIRRPIESGDNDSLVRLRSLTDPFLMRRTKASVAPDLPDKVESTIDVDLGTEHRQIYDQFLTRERGRILGLLDDPQANRMSILAALTRMRQLALDPALVDSSYQSVGSAKIEVLLEQLEQILPTGHQALVFSQFTSYLDRIRAAMDRRGITYSVIEGKTRNRDAQIERFRDGEAQVFLISLKAGGTGLTLTEADYVYLMDPWWNPAAEAQAVDRAHRIGQEHKVNVYRLVAVDTIEQKVMDLQDRKRQLVTSLIDGRRKTAPTITAADLRALLSN